MKILLFHEHSDYPHWIILFDSSREAASLLPELRVVRDHIHLFFNVLKRDLNNDLLRHRQTGTLIQSCQWAGFVIMIGFSHHMPRETHKKYKSVPLQWLLNVNSNNYGREAWFLVAGTKRKEKKFSLQWYWSGLWGSFHFALEHWAGTYRWVTRVQFPALTGGGGHQTPVNSSHLVFCCFESEFIHSEAQT